MTRAMKIPRLAGLAEVATILSVTRQRAGQITQTRRFPDPLQRLAMGPVWLESDVLAYRDTERPGQLEQEGEQPILLNGDQAARIGLITVEAARGDSR
jgi:hypothetical protein